MPLITSPRTRVIKIPDNIPRPADPCVHGIQEPALIPAVSWHSCSFTGAGHKSKFRETGLTSRPCPASLEPTRLLPSGAAAAARLHLAQHPRMPTDEVAAFSCILTTNGMIINSIGRSRRGGALWMGKSQALTRGRQIPVWKGSRGQAIPGKDHTMMAGCKNECSQAARNGMHGRRHRVRAVPGGILAQCGHFCSPIIHAAARRRCAFTPQQDLEVPY